MSSGGEYPGGVSSEDERNTRQNSRSNSTNAMGRRQPVDLPDDDDSDDDHPPQSPSPQRRRNNNKSSSSKRQYDDDDSDDNRRKSSSGGRDRTYDDDDDDDIKPHRPSSSGKRRDNFEDNSDNDYDDEYEDDLASRARGAKKGRGKRAGVKKRNHSDDEYGNEDDDRDDRRDDDGDDGIERESRKQKKVKREQWEDNGDRRGLDGDGGDEDEDNRRRGRDERESGDGNMTAVDKAIEKTKASRNRRRNEPDDSVVEGECVAFLESMKKARDEDLKSFNRGQPALEKIKMLKNVEKIMNKVYHRKYLLDNMILAAFRSWLNPLPDGSLPNIQVRTTLLDILHDFPTDEDWVERLEGSQGLGKVINYLSKSDDHAPNKRLAEKIMMKWARPVYQMNSNFQELLYEFDKPDEAHRAGRESVASERKAAMRTVARLKTTEDKLRDSRGKDQKSTKIMASEPRPTPFLFTTLPEGSTEMGEKEAKDLRVNRAKQKRMSRTITNLRRLSKASGARGTKPSINGR